MDFGKLLSVDHVDFRLPPDPPQNEAVLGALPPILAPKLFLGATGYNMKDWAGKWYPAGAKEKDFLRHYGAQFNTIEHNTTHYRIPDTATVDRWYDETPADFRFCPKIPQTISHARDLGLSARQIEYFCEVIQGLEEKLGCCFLQLPPYFSTQHIMVLLRFLDRFPPEVPLAIEVRHESFFQETVQSEAFFELLRSHRIATVITDVAGRRDVCHMHLSTGRVLIRFVGNGLHPTDYTRIQDWSARLADWTAAGLKEIFFFTHEPDNLLAPDLAIYCAETFKTKMPEAIIRGPKVIETAAGIQGSLF